MRNTLQGRFIKSEQVSFKITLKRYVGINWRHNKGIVIHVLILGQCMKVE